MNDISLKNQKFIIEGMNLLTSLNDLKDCEFKIFNELKEFKKGSIIDRTELFKLFDNAEYFKVKTNDIVSTVSLHVSKVQYEQMDIQENITGVEKNAHIGNITLKMNIFSGDFIPPFNVTITNLGLGGVVKETDEVYIKLYYPHLSDYSEKIIYLPSTISELMESITLTIENLRCPERAYEYNLIVQVRNKITKKVFGEAELKAINITKEVPNVI